MDKTTPTENQLEVTAEEKQFDQEVLSETKEEEVRSSLIEKYGLNEEDNAELLDQLVADNLESRKKLSKAVQQKINYRDKHPLLNSNLKLRKLRELRSQRRKFLLTPKKSAGKRRK